MPTPAQSKSPSPQALALVAAGSFRIALCTKFAEHGKCPYSYRCMFAHGVDELRTVEENQRDGLVTKVAIETWRVRRAKRARRSGARGPTQSHVRTTSNTTTNSTDSSATTASTTSISSDSAMRLPKRQRYRHDPYHALLRGPCGWKVPGDETTIQ